MSMERLRARLIKAGYDEDEVVGMDRNELLSTCAEYLLSPPIPESPEKAEGGAIGGMSAEEWEFRKQELKRQKEERLQREFEYQKEKQEKEEERRKQEKERRQGELEMRRQEREEDLDRQR